MRMLAILVPAAWFALFVAAPILVLAIIAVSVPEDGIPPFGWPGGGPDWTALRTLATDEYYLQALLASLRIAGVTAAGTLLLGYPMAYAIARASPRLRTPLLMLVMLPFWTGFLLRINAWIGLLRDDGPVARLSHWLGLARGPLLYTDWAMYLGLVHAYLPFMVLPLYATLSRIDPALGEAAADLGASPSRVFRAITLPLSMPGVWAGFMLVFIPAVGEYVVPELLGGPGAQTIGRVVWAEFFQNRDWPQAAALAVALILTLVLPAVALLRTR